jgi:predicted nucleotidyltransferase
MAESILGRDPRLDDVVRRLVEAYQPESIYLFGSIARGDGDAESDYDLLIIVPNDAPAERRQSRLAYEVLRGTGTPVDALVCSHDWFFSRVHLRASLPATVLREGRLLHAA